MMLGNGSIMRTRRAEPGLAASKGPRLGASIRALFVCLLAGSLAFSTAVPAVAAEKKKQSDLGTILKAPKVDSTEPMLLQADEMIYDNENNRVTAKGNVEIYYGNYTLLADQVIYDRNANTLAAQGNVRIKDPEGAIITSNQMTLTDDFRDGFIDALRVVTKDDTRIVAQTASREAGNVTVFHNGWFTPCKPCEENPDKPPTWRIRAKTIIHRKDEATITYRNGFFDFFGVPIIWLPYFQSADPTVKRKSGFLMPMYSQSGRLGTTVTVPYYFALSDNYDFTFAPMYTSEQGILWQGSWRQRLASGGYRVDLAGVFNDGSFEFPEDINSDFRGSIVTQGKFALNPYWSWGWDGTAASDDTFRRFYGLDSEVKTDQISQLYLEGLHDRNYFGMKFYQTNTLLATPDPLADATVYPIIDYDYIVKNPIVGGELSFNSNVMALANADGTDSNRLIVEANWRRQMIDGIGEVFTPFARIRGDLYGVNEFVDPSTDLNSSGALVRGVAVGGAEYRYPFIGTTGSVAHVFEPIAQIIGRPDAVGVDQSEIPDEDARSLVFDDTILFDIDKFSGYDRIETGTRANVGGRYTAQFANGAYARAVFGESYQIAGQNSFDVPGFQNSGLATRSSDYVGGLYLQAARYLSLIAQSRFNVDTFEVLRTDLGATASVGPIDMTVNYADVAPEAVSPALTTTTLTTIANTNQPGDQEIAGKGVLKLTDTWALLGAVRYDIENAQRISDGVGLRYENDCMTAAVTYEQTNIQDQDIRPDQRVLVRLSLKYLGTYEYETDAFGGTYAEAPNTGVATSDVASTISN
jgi:LPS-assembly protein